MSTPLVIDLYDLIHIEELAKACLTKQHTGSFSYVLQYILQQLLHGDYFICASERQRDFWLGMLSAARRINPLTFSKDASLRNLIDVVPFGIPEKSPKLTKKILKGVYPGIKASDKVVLWAGGIWEWLDPFTPIKAMHILGQKRSDVKLFFLGTQRPFTEKTITHPVVAKAVALSKELGLINRSVFFNDDWVPYCQRQNYLLEADIGVTASYNSLETHFSWRTRLLDYIWAGVPVISNGGDSLSLMLAQKEMGLLFNNSCAKELAEKILTLLDKQQNDRFKKNITDARQDFTWEKAVAPLVKFCRNPQKAADKKDL